jgi:NAD(P)-dependent dehydrogenase (short-subunit alcohol dehydrogenase family)
MAATTSSALPPERSGRVAYVTGATGGVGRAIVHELARQGYLVVASDRDALELERVAESVRSRAGDCRTSVCDLADASECEHAMNRVATEIGELDVLVNNAATWFFEPFLATTDEHWREVLEVNVVAPARLSRLAAPLLGRSHSPRIVNIASKNGLRGEPGLSSYDVSKAALIALTRVLAVELAASGILVNCVAPGVLDTESNRGMLEDPDRSEVYRNRIPLGRFGSPDEVASVVGFLCGSHSGFATGATFILDGGQLAGEQAG